MDQIFSQLKDFLRYFNYPLINSINEDDFFNIFHSSNRRFLITWILELLDENYKKYLEMSKSESVIADLVCELGFCNDKEKLLFITGGLDENKQLKILIDMLNYVKTIRCSKDNPILEHGSKFDINSLKTTDLNLFPNFGDIKLSSKPPENIDELLERNDDTLRQDSLQENVPDDLNAIIRELRDTFPSVQKYTEDLDDTKDTDCIQIDPELPDILKTCNENLKVINEYIQDIKTIQDFLESNSRPEYRHQDGDYDEMLKNLTEEINDVFLEIQGSFL